MLRQVVKRKSDPLRHKYHLEIDIYADEFDAAKMYEAELYNVLLRFHELKRRDVQCPVELVVKEKKEL